MRRVTLARFCVCNKQFFLPIFFTTMPNSTSSWLLQVNRCVFAWTVSEALLCLRDGANFGAPCSNLDTHFFSTVFCDDHVFLCTLMDGGLKLKTRVIIYGLTFYESGDIFVKSVTRIKLIHYETEFSFVLALIEMQLLQSGQDATNAFLTDDQNELNEFNAKYILAKIQFSEKREQNSTLWKMMKERKKRWCIQNEK